MASFLLAVAAAVVVFAAATFFVAAVWLIGHFKSFDDANR